MPDTIDPVLLARRALPVAVHRSKLEPPRFAGNWVRRERVEQRLDRALACSLVVVVAPAGHGKTSTVADWLRRRRIVPAWVTLDPRDTDLTRLATHVAVAIDGVVPGAAETLIPLLTAADRLPPRDLGEAFGEALYDLAGDLVLVLDDAHAVDREAGGAFVAGLVRAAPRRLHTILVSREQPAFPLSRLRIAGEVEELGGADLRFSADETAELLRVESRAAVDAADAERVRAAVGGWPAAVRLIAIGHGLGGADRPTGIASDGRRAVLDYLGEEVLSRLPAVQRAALHRASLVERFTGELMAVLAGAPGGRPLTKADIEQLRALELFREIPGQAETWYAFHPLFRDVLRRDLERTTAEPALTDTRRAAARWLAGAGRVREAVDLLVAIGDIGQATATIEAELDDAFNREDWQSVASWVRAVPFEEILNRPELLLAVAWVGYLGGREARAAEALAAIRQPRLRDRVSAAQQAEIDLLADWPEEPRADELGSWSRWAESAVAAIPPGRRYQRGYARLMLAMSLASAGRADEALERLAAFTDGASARIDAESIRGWFGRTIVLWQAGRLAQCGRAAADLLQLAQTNGLPVSTGWGAAFVGLVAHELGDAGTAVAQFDFVVGNADRVHYICVRNVFFGQALLYQASGRDAEADRALERLRELAIATESRNQLALVDAMAARVALLRGEVDVARRWLESSPAAPEADDLKHIEVRGLTRAKVLVALGTRASLAAARVALDAFVAAARAERMALALIEGLAVRALLHEAVGDRPAADHDLRESLRLAAPERIVQRFAYLGPGLLPLLRRAANDPAVAAHARPVLRLAEAVAANQRGAPAVRPAAPALPSPLTGRELEVLACLARRLTNDEIGDELFISPVTAKHHVANIAGKLGVSGRRAAVGRARELGLLDLGSGLGG